jgi:hypothetical protein
MKITIVSARFTDPILSPRLWPRSDDASSSLQPCDKARGPSLRFLLAKMLDIGFVGVVGFIKLIVAVFIVEWSIGTSTLFLEVRAAAIPAGL